MVNKNRTALLIHSIKEKTNCCFIYELRLWNEGVHCANKDGQINCWLFKLSE